MKEVGGGYLQNNRKIEPRIAQKQEKRSEIEHEKDMQSIIHKQEQRPCSS